MSYIAPYSNAHWIISLILVAPLYWFERMVATQDSDEDLWREKMIDRLYRQHRRGL